MLKTAVMLIPLFLIAGIAFWLILPQKSQPIIVNDQTQISNSGLTDLTQKIEDLETKVDTLESSNSALLQRLNNLPSPNLKSSNLQSSNKNPVLLPINPGGSINSTTWENLTTGTVTVNPSDYPGYKNAYLIMNLSVYVGQGVAYAQLVNAQNGLAIIPSKVQTGSDQPVNVTSGPFQLPAGSNTYTIQMYTQVPGYPAQAGDSFLQITY